MRVNIERLIAELLAMARDMPTRETAMILTMIARAIEKSLEQDE